jgi:hypothetical protein
MSSTSAASCPARQLRRVRSVAANVRAFNTRVVRGLVVLGAFSAPGFAIGAYATGANVNTLRAWGAVIAALIAYCALLYGLVRAVHASGADRDGRPEQALKPMLSTIGLNWAAVAAVMALTEFTSDLTTFQSWAFNAGRAVIALAAVLIGLSVFARVRRAWANADPATGAISASAAGVP